MKVCSKCKIEKDFCEFTKNTKSKSGLYSSCKECIKKYRSTEEYIAKRKERVKKYYQKNIEKMRAEKIKYYSNHKKEKAAYDVEYRKKNAEKFAQSKREYEERNKNNPDFKIRRNLRRRIHHALLGKHKVDRTFNLLGCSVEFFKEYIAKQFRDGMTWENYGAYWHIDHKKPCVLFDMSKESEQRECFHYTNMQPLLAIENLKKSRSYKIPELHQE